MKLFYLLFLALFSVFMQAQDVFNDSFNKMNDKELLSHYNEADADSVKAEKIIRIYLDRSRKEKDSLKMAEAYVLLTEVSKAKRSLIFADSAIYLSTKLNDKNYPAEAYFEKALTYEQIGELKLAIKNYTDAYKLTLKNKNIIQQVKISNRLILLKSVWGNKQEALELQKKRDQLMKTKAYIKEFRYFYNGNEKKIENRYALMKVSSTANFVVCYTELKFLDSASIHLKKGIQENKEYKGELYKKYYDNWFIAVGAEIDYYKGNYKKSIVTNTELLETITPADIFKSIIFKDAYLFKGLSFIKLGDPRKGIEILKKADSIFEKEDVLKIYPYHRDLFVELRDYYSSRNNMKMKKKYIDKLMVIDSIFKKNYAFFEPDLIRNYERPQLLEKKEEVITDLKQKHKKSSVKIWLMLAFLIISLIIIIYYFKRQQLYKIRFNNLMLQKEFSKQKDIRVIPNSKNGDSNSINSGVPSEIEANILNHLEDFELKRAYLSQELSLQNMAKTFGTNYNYLSKVINFNKGKNLSSYINDLRIEYSFEELKLNQNLRKYTIKAIAFEFGFSSAESFSKKFYKKYGIYPSFYIKKLEK